MGFLHCPTAIAFHLHCLTHVWTFGSNMIQTALGYSVQVTSNQESAMMFHPGYVDWPIWNSWNWNLMFSPSWRSPMMSNMSCKSTDNRLVDSLPHKGSSPLYYFLTTQEWWHNFFILQKVCLVAPSSSLLVMLLWYGAVWYLWIASCLIAAYFAYPNFFWLDRNRLYGKN